MFVGEQPGDKEDVEGRPFVGPAGAVVRQGSRRGWHRSQTDLRHERGKAFQVGAARQASHPQEAELPGNLRLPAVAGRRDCPGPAGRDRVSGSYCGSGSSGTERFALPGNGASYCRLGRHLMYWRRCIHLQFCAHRTRKAGSGNFGKFVARLVGCCKIVASKRCGLRNWLLNKVTESVEMSAIVLLRQRFQLVIGVTVTPELEQIRQEVERVISGSSELNWRQAPPGKWTSAQIFEHLLLTYTGTTKGLRRVLESGHPLASVCNLAAPVRKFVVTKLGWMPAGRTAFKQICPEDGLDAQSMRRFYDALVAMDATLLDAERRFGKRAKAAGSSLPRTIECSGMASLPPHSYPPSSEASG